MMKLPPAQYPTRLSGLARSGELTGVQAANAVAGDAVDTMQPTTPRAPRPAVALREPVAPGAPRRTAVPAASTFVLVAEDAAFSVPEFGFESFDLEPLTHAPYGDLIAQQLERGRPMVLCALRTGLTHRHFYVPEDLSTWLSLRARNPMTNEMLPLQELEVWVVLPGDPRKVHFVCTERDYIEKNRLGCVGWMMINAYRADAPALRLLARAAGGSAMNPLSPTDPDCTPENLQNAFKSAIDFRMPTTASVLWRLAVQVLPESETNAMLESVCRMTSGG